MQFLRREWARKPIGSVAPTAEHPRSYRLRSFAGERYEGGGSACPKHQVQRLVREIRKQRF